MSVSENLQDMTAWKLIEQLDELYRGFAAAAAGSAKSGLAGLFGLWFHSPDPSNAEPICADFLKGVQALSTELAEAMRREDAAIRGACARTAAGIMLTAKPANTKSRAEWYMVAAEYAFAVLIPYIPPETLNEIRADYMRDNPERRMYPRQRELLRMMKRHG